MGKTNNGSATKAGGGRQKRKGAAQSNPFHEVRRPKAFYKPARFLTMGQAVKLTGQMPI